MSAIDGWLEGFLYGPAGVGAVLLISLLLGLRHASDPDHLAAVTTLIASEEPEAVRKATFMGLSWGLWACPLCCSAGIFRRGSNRPRRWL